MQLKDELRALRRSINSRSDPYILDPSRPSPAKKKAISDVPPSSSSAKPAKLASAADQALARARAVNLTSDEEDDDDEFN